MEAVMGVKIAVVAQMTVAVVREDASLAVVTTTQFVTLMRKALPVPIALTFNRF